MSKKRQPWNLQPGETANAFAAFCVYRDQDGKRSVAKAAKILGKNVTTMGQWSSKYGWIERVRSWEAEKDRVSTEAEAREVEKMKARQIKLALQMQEKGGEGLTVLQADEMTARDVTRMVKEGAQLERVNRGEPVEIVRHEGDTDLSRLSDEDLEAANRIRKKARGDE